jgi:hypothetical protein
MAAGRLSFRIAADRRPTTDDRRPTSASGQSIPQHLLSKCHGIDLGKPCQLASQPPETLLLAPAEALEIRQGVCGEFCRPPRRVQGDCHESQEARGLSLAGSVTLLAKGKMVVPPELRIEPRLPVTRAFAATRVSSIHSRSRPSRVLTGNLGCTHFEKTASTQRITHVAPDNPISKTTASQRTHRRCVKNTIHPKPTTRMPAKNGGTALNLTPMAAKARPKTMCARRLSQRRTQERISLKSRWLAFGIPWAD